MWFPTLADASLKQKNQSAANFDNLFILNTKKRTI